ncbi:NADH-ubiquinone oxidoreductase 9.5 kDa subunit [Cenococcum geophilum 1.58]|uniref:NADH-ubiquinone oxidoreductase 9.5 kDa subunit n=1 Tax=Cenococcum geophilum 1.58 TaxID=794803 RepID=UPI00358FC3B1|nr:NADH-ubiquinone oxidoreductase 9.5 kDa subunit [Cenococcum geophilum 1.58]
MSSAPYFFRQPIRYMRWASHEKPAIFYSIVIGSMGPVTILAAPPIRRYFGDGPRPKIPLTYPIPKGPRQIPEGYDD